MKYIAPALGVFLLLAAAAFFNRQISTPGPGPRPWVRLFGGHRGFAHSLVAVRLLDACLTLWDNPLPGPARLQAKKNLYGMLDILKDLSSEKTGFEQVFFTVSQTLLFDLQDPRMARSVAGWGIADSVGHAAPKSLFLMAAVVSHFFLKDFQDAGTHYTRLWQATGLPWQKDLAQSLFNHRDPLDKFPQVRQQLLRQLRLEGEASTPPDPPPHVEPKP